MAPSNVEEVNGPDASQPFLGTEPDAKWKQAQSRVSMCQYFFMSLAQDNRSLTSNAATADPR